MSDDPMSKHIVIDGVPSNVTVDKIPVFTKMMNKKLSEKLGISADMFKFTIQSDEDGVPLGAFMEFAKVEDADKAVAVLNKMKITKTDQFRTSHWSAFEKFANMEEEYEEPAFDMEQDDGYDMTNPFVLDAAARPQLLVKGGTSYDVEWYWFNTEKGRMDLIRKPNAAKDDNISQWTDIDRRSRKLQRGMPKPFPMWSPQGNFIVTLHRSGLKMWGGRTMQQIGEIQETDINAVQISPNEKYIVVLTNELSIYEVSTSKLLRTLSGLDADLNKWPIAKFNADDSILAIQLRESRLNMYDTSSMKLLAGTTERVNYTVEVDNLRNFEWSPTNPQHIAYVMEGTVSQGWRVSVDTVYVDDMFVTLESLGRRNFFNTDEVNFLWHPAGNFTAAKISKTNGSTEYCIFRVSSKTASAEQLEVKGGKALRFSWQPDAPNFIISTAAQGAKKSMIHFYSAAKLGFALLGSFESEADGLFWAPKGGHVAVVSFGRSSIEFFEMQDNNKKVSFTVKAEHPYVTGCEWDPTGRYLASVTSSLKHELDNRYQIYNVNGTQIVDQRLERLSHVVWRPLPPTLLSEDELAKVKAELPKRSAKYTKDAHEEQRKKDEEEDERKRKLAEKYIKTMNELHEHHVKKGYAEKRAALHEKAPSTKRIREQLLAIADETFTETVTREVIESETPM